MTWVMGRPTWLGISACVAVVQVTVGDETFDCLRKLYGLEANVLAGFAGNVKTGFPMLARLQQLTDVQKSSEEDPANISALFHEYPGVARDLFASLPAELQHGGSAVLIGAAEPAANTLYGCLSRGACFRSPEFAAEEIPHREWDSIGSGSGIAAYKAELEKITSDEADGLLQMEVGRPGGHAEMMAQFLTMQVSELPPVPGISTHFHIEWSLLMGRDRWRLNSSSCSEGPAALVYRRVDRAGPAGGRVPLYESVERTDLTAAQVYAGDRRNGRPGNGGRKRDPRRPTHPPLSRGCSSAG